MEFGLEQPQTRPVVFVKNLDEWFLSIYRYWYRKGLTAMVASGLAHILTLMFTILFSFFLFAMVNWGKVSSCRDKSSCSNGNWYVRRKFPNFPHSPGRDSLALLYLVVFLLYWLWTCCASLFSLINAWEVRDFYRQELHITTHVRWNEVVAKLSMLQRSGRAPWRPGETFGELSAHDVACRIMRKDNYLVAMAGILPVKLTKTLEWSLYACFDIDGRDLKRRFIVAGIVHVLLMPFLLAFMSLRFFLMNAQEWRENKTLGPREWSTVARWQFRELNELPHVFEARLNASREHADNYLKMFPRPILAALARTVAFIAGAFVATLVFLVAVLPGGDALLLYVHLGDKNLLWYFGAASVIFAIARSFENEVDEFVEPQRFEDAMAKVAQHTHCFPEEWRGKCNTHQVRAAFSAAFRYKIVLFFEEISSVLLAPLVLCFALPRCANDVQAFVKDNTVVLDGFGPVLRHSLFDFEEPKVNAKLQTSIDNFRKNNPEWSPAAFPPHVHELSGATPYKPPRPLPYGGGGGTAASDAKPPPPPRSSPYGGGADGTSSADDDDDGANSSHNSDAARRMRARLRPVTHPRDDQTFDRLDAQANRYPHTDMV